MTYTRDANEIAAAAARAEREDAPVTVGRQTTPRYGRLLGVTADGRAPLTWPDVAVLPYGSGTSLLMLEHQDDNLRTIVNAQGFLFLEFRPNDDAGE